VEHNLLICFYIKVLQNYTCPVTRKQNLNVYTAINYSFKKG